MLLESVSSKAKILFNVVVITLLLLTMFIFNKATLDGIVNDATAIRDTTLEHTFRAQGLKNSVLQVQQWLTDISATRGLPGYDDGYAEAEKHAKEFRYAITLLADAYREEGNDAELKVLEQTLSDFEDYYRVGKEMAQHYIDGGPEAGNIYMERFDPYAEKLTRMVEALVVEEKNELTLAIDKITKDTAIANRNFIGFSLAIIVINVVISLLIITVTFKRFNILTQIINRLESGDFTPGEKLAGRDEAGVIGSSIERMRSKLSAAIMATNREINRLASSASDLTDTSVELNNGAKDTLSRANSVAASAEEMSSNMTTIAAAMEQSSTNVDAMAAATEEMSANIGELAGNTERTLVSTRNAVEKSHQTSTQVDALGRAANEIGQMTETISAISEKTNLLALNATIEAARAGEAGKGFAVVANEIKDLAHQTAAATTDIEKKLKTIQGTVKVTVEDITDFSKTIQDIDANVSTIVEAMEQQKLATAEISSNVGQVSSGIAEVNESVSQSSQASSLVAKEITEVTQLAETLHQSSSTVEGSANNVNSMSEAIRNSLSLFRVEESGFDSGRVKTAHAQWKRKLSGMLSGKERLRPDDISDHHHCAFGQWYDGEGEENFGSLPAFRAIKNEHRRVHETAKKIAHLYNSGKEEEAHTLFTEFKQLTTHLFKLLDDLEDAANR
ncbi:MAG: CZB domain-containing protein [Gammaproteobacteria bacterium]|nr:CZB domain-containing protein [Gammaproteobacteria bacterium]